MADSSRSRSSGGVTAPKESAELVGTLLVKPLSFVNDEQSCRCSFNGSEIGLIHSLDQRHDSGDLDRFARRTNLRIDRLQYEIEVVAICVLNLFLDRRKRRRHVPRDLLEVERRRLRLSLEIQTLVL